MIEEIKIEGFAELERRLMDIPVKIARRILARSAYAGAAYMREEARRKWDSVAKKQTGVSRRAIRVYKKRSRRGMFEAVYSVGTKRPEGRWMERGTKQHVIRSKKPMGIDGRFGTVVKHPGQAPRPWLRPTFDFGIPGAIDAVRDKMKAGIEAGEATR